MHYVYGAIVAFVMAFANANTAETYVPYDEDTRNLSSHSVTLPSCDNEDGNTDGLPCWWTDPDTGRGYYVSSDEYRNVNYGSDFGY